MKVRYVLSVLLIRVEKGGNVRQPLYSEFMQAVSKVNENKIQ